MGFSHTIHVIYGFVVKELIHEASIVKDLTGEFFIELPNGDRYDTLYGEFPRDVVFIGELLCSQDSKYSEYQSIPTTEKFINTDKINELYLALKEAGFDIIQPFSMWLVETAS